MQVVRDRRAEDPDIVQGNRVIRALPVRGTAAIAAARDSIVRKREGGPIILEALRILQHHLIRVVEVVVQTPVVLRLNRNLRTVAVVIVVYGRELRRGIQRLQLQRGRTDPRSRNRIIREWVADHDVVHRRGTIRVKNHIVVHRPAK